MGTFKSSKKQEEVTRNHRTSDTKYSQKEINESMQRTGFECIFRRLDCQMIEIKEVYFTEEYACAFGTVNGRSSCILAYTMMKSDNDYKFMNENIEKITEISKHIFNFEDIDIYAVGIFLYKREPLAFKDVFSIADSVSIEHEFTKKEQGPYCVGDKYDANKSEFCLISPAKDALYGMTTDTPILVSKYDLDSYASQERFKTEHNKIDFRLCDIINVPNSDSQVYKFEVDVVACFAMDGGYTVFKYYVYITEYCPKLLERSELKTIEDRKKTIVFFKWQEYERGSSAVSKNIINGNGKLKWCIRKEPINSEDNGWRFLSDIDTSDFLNVAGNMQIMDWNDLVMIEPAVSAIFDEDIGNGLVFIDDNSKWPFRYADDEEIIF